MAKKIMTYTSHQWTFEFFLFYLIERIYSGTKTIHRGKKKMTQFSRMSKLKKEGVVCTYGSGNARPLTIIESMTCSLHGQINIFFISFCNSCYHLSTSWIYRLERFTYIIFFFLGFG